MDQLKSVMLTLKCKPHLTMAEKSIKVKFKYRYPHLFKFLIVTGSLLAFLEAGAGLVYMNRVELLAYIEHRLSTTRVPFEVVVSSEHTKALKIKSLNNLSEPDIDQIKHRALTISKTWVDAPYDGLSDKTVASLDKLTDVPHQYLYQTFPVGVGNDRKGFFVIMDYLLVNDTKKFKNALVAVYPGKDGRISDSHMIDVVDTKKGCGKMSSIKTTATGIEQSANLIKRLKSMLEDKVVLRLSVEICGCLILRNPLLPMVSTS